MRNVGEKSILDNFMKIDSFNIPGPVVKNMIQESIQYYVINFVSDLRQVVGFLWVLWFPPPPWYNWNIVESGIEHHKPKPNRFRIFIISGFFHRSI